MGPSAPWPSTSLQSLARPSKWYTSLIAWLLLTVTLLLISNKMVPSFRKYIPIFPISSFLFLAIYHFSYFSFSMIFSYGIDAYLSSIKILFDLKFVVYSKLYSPIGLICLVCDKCMFGKMWYWTIRHYLDEVGMGRIKCLYFNSSIDTHTFFFFSLNL